jgi:hypothetical protein
VPAKLARNGGAMPRIELARLAGMTLEEGRPTGDLLVSRGMVTRTGGELTLAPGGREVAGKLAAAQQRWMTGHLAGRSPQQHAELPGTLERLAREILGDDADRRLAGYQEKAPARR